MSQRFRWSVERQVALEDLRKNGRASTRNLAKRWGWTHSKAVRFLAFLDSHPDVLNRNSVPVNAVPVNAYPKHHVPVKDAPLEKYLLDKKTLEAGSGYTSDLIDEMNRLLRGRFGSDYRQVLHDNDSSVATGQELQAAGIELSWALMTLRRHVMRFHPEKMGGGNLPGSLKYWKRGLLRDWKSRAQTEIPLLTIEKPHPLTGVHAYVDPSAKKIERPTHVFETACRIIEQQAGQA